MMFPILPSMVQFRDICYQEDMSLFASESQGREGPLLQEMEVEYSLWGLASENCISCILTGQTVPR